MTKLLELTQNLELRVLNYIDNDKLGLYRLLPLLMGVN